jgi:MIP family channel proteins
LRRSRRAGKPTRQRRTNQHRISAAELPGCQPNTALQEISEPDQRNGGFLNTTLKEYPITVNADMGEIHVSLIDEPDPILNPVGTERLGEASIVGVALPLSTRSSTRRAPTPQAADPHRGRALNNQRAAELSPDSPRMTRGAGPVPPARTNPPYGVMDLNTTTTGRRQPRPAYWTARQTQGLHGHPLEGNTIRTAVAEAVGTFILVLTITSTAVAATLAKPLAGAPYDSLVVPIAGGLSLAVLAASLGHVSGAHLNPAITLGLALNRRFPWSYAPAYLLAQFAGAIGAAALTWGLYGNQARTQANLGATYPAAGVGLGRVFAAEAVVTFVLAIVIISVATDSRVPRAVAAMAIGSALAVAILISGPISGAGVNPARAIGPMILTGRLTGWWAYLTAPAIGGALAVATYERFLRKGSTPDAHAPAAGGPEPT